MDNNENDVQKKLVLYNEHNILLKSDDINNILARFKINKKINSLELWQKAFAHKSYSKNNKKKQYLYDFEANKTSKCIEIQEDSNERLEWLGDGIIQAISAAYLSKRYPDQDEGFLTKTRSKIVKTESLYKLAKFISIEKYILMSYHVEFECNGRNNPRILEDAFEAFIGALYNDFDKNNNNYSGFSTCYKFFINIIQSGGLDIPQLILTDDNYKDQLMRFYQKEFNGKYPIYYELQDSSKKSFTMCVNDPEGKLVGTGVARSKKEAEQKAAKQALEYFNTLK